MTERPQAGPATPIDQAVILAGGLGTRLRAVVSDVPKPMAPVAGRPFLEHQIDYWAAQGIRRIVLSVAYLGESIVAHFGKRYRGCEIDYAVEETPLGTGGGVLLASRMMPADRPFLLLNGDTFFQVELAGVAAFHHRTASDWTICLFRPGETGRYGGVEIGPDGGVLSFLDKSAAAGKLANGGVYLVNPRVINTLLPGPPRKASLETDLMPALLAAGARVRGIECPGRFLDIGVPADYARAAEFVSPRSSR